MALSAERKTVRYGQEPLPALHAIKMAATKIWGGSLVAISAGYLQPATSATALIVLGRAEETVDNTGGAAGDKLCNVLTGVFKWKNSAAADLIAQTEVGKGVYAVDDQTVAKTDGTGTRSYAGVCVGVDADGVWVYSNFKLP